MTTTLSRAGAALAASGLLIGMLSACAPEPSPEPTKTPKPTSTAIFDSDEEAFAAAEKTYREYQDAANAEHRGEPDADPDTFLIGTALSETLEARRTLNEMGYTLVGEVPLLKVVPDRGSISADRSQLTLTACSDLTQSRMVLENGEEVELPERPDTTASQAEMTWTDDGYRVSAESEGDLALCDG